MGVWNVWDSKWLFGVVSGNLGWFGVVSGC